MTASERSPWVGVLREVCGGEGLGGCTVLGNTEERGWAGDLTRLDVPFCTLPLPGC